MPYKLKQFFFKPLASFGISQKLQATALWSFIESFSNPFFTLLLIPILTHNLGLENYGLYVMVMAFVSFFSFTGLGMNTSITYYLAVNYETSNPQNIAERLGSALFLTLLSTLIFACLFLFTFQLLKPLIQTYYQEFINQKNLIYLALMLVVITQLDLVVSASIKGLQQFKTSSKVEFTLRLFSFTAIALVAFVKKNVLSVALITSIMAVFTLIVRYKILSDMVQFHFFDIKLNKQNAFELFHFGKWMSLQNIFSAILSSLDKLMLGYYFNTSTVGTYNIILTITQLTHYLIANATTFIFPKISASNATHKSLYAYGLKLLPALIGIVFFIMVGLAMIYPLISNYFHLGNVKLEFYILLTTYGAAAISIIPYYFLLGTGNVKLITYINSISALVSAISIFLLISKYGLMGASVARAISTAFGILGLVALHYKIKNSSRDIL